MTRQRKPSASTRLVLSHLLEGPCHGYSLIKDAGLKSGTLYPILMRLTDRGLLTSSWEPPQVSGRPPRQVYTLTPDGRAYARAALCDHKAAPLSRGHAS